MVASAAASYSACVAARSASRSCALLGLAAAARVPRVAGLTWVLVSLVMRLVSSFEGWLRPGGLPGGGRLGLRRGRAGGARIHAAEHPSVEHVGAVGGLVGGLISAGTVPRPAGSVKA